MLLGYGDEIQRAIMNMQKPATVPVVPVAPATPPPATGAWRTVTPGLATGGATGTWRSAATLAANAAAAAAAPTGVSRQLLAPATILGAPRSSGAFTFIKGGAAPAGGTGLPIGMGPMSAPGATYPPPGAEPSAASGGGGGGGGGDMLGPGDAAAMADPAQAAALAAAAAASARSAMIQTWALRLGIAAAVGGGLWLLLRRPSAA